MILQEQIQYNLYCQSKRKRIFEDLMKELGLTATIASSLSFPTWLHTHNLSVTTKMNTGGFIKWGRPMEMDFNNDEIADAYLDFANAKNDKSLTVSEQAQASKKFNDTLKKQAKIMGLSKSKTNKDEQIKQNKKNIKKLKKALKKQKEDNMPTVEEVRRGIKKYDDQPKEDLKEIALENPGKKIPLLKLRPEIEIGGKKTRNYIKTSDPVTIQTTGSYLTNDLSIQFGNTETPTDSSPKKESTKGFVFENNFDDTPVDEVYDHFYSGFIYEKERDRQKDYLSESDLHKFLKAAFEKKEPPKKLFTIKNDPKNAPIWKVFHTYFKTVSINKETKKAAIYASLLEDYFRNWPSVQTNWTKYGKDD